MCSPPSRSPSPASSSGHGLATGVWSDGGDSRGGWGSLPPLHAGASPLSLPFCPFAGSLQIAPPNAWHASGSCEGEGLEPSLIFLAPSASMSDQQPLLANFTSWIDPNLVVSRALCSTVFMAMASISLPASSLSWLQSFSVLHSVCLKEGLLPSPVRELAVSLPPQDKDPSSPEDTWALCTWLRRAFGFPVLLPECRGACSAGTVT